VEAYGDDVFASFQAELFFGLNVRSPALKNAALRQAIALAIDREAIIDEVYAERDRPPVSAPVPTRTGGRSADKRSHPDEPEKSPR